MIIISYFFYKIKYSAKTYTEKDRDIERRRNKRRESEENLGEKSYVSDIRIPNRVLHCICSLFLFIPLIL